MAPLTTVAEQNSLAERARPIKHVRQTFVLLVRQKLANNLAEAAEKLTTVADTHSLARVVLRDKRAYRMALVVNRSPATPSAGPVRTVAAAR